MPSPTAGSAAPARKTRTLAQTYRRFAEVDAPETSPLYERVAVALSESDEALRAIEAAPARRRHPTVIIAALHDLALAGRAPALAAAYADGDGDAAAGAAIDMLLEMTDAVVALAGRRPTLPDELDRAGGVVYVGRVPRLGEGRDDAVEALPGELAVGGLEPRDRVVIRHLLGVAGGAGAGRVVYPLPARSVLVAVGAEPGGRNAVAAGRCPRAGVQRHERPRRAWEPAKLDRPRCPGRLDVV